MPPGWRRLAARTFQQLLSELVRHEVAEEEILRPVSKRDAGAAIANARIKEESKAEELLKEMEKLDPGSAEFTTKLAKLRREVERHAEAEETKEFPRVARKETAERLEQMGKAYAAAKKAAPTRPHPSTPNTPGPISSPGRSPRSPIGRAMRCGTP
jgi:iron-sulfur cluster repair protein YtfE (RIC family)